MGTVLSFSPRERRPVYSTHHHSGSGLSSSGSADHPLNNYSYEQLNNAKNREINKPSCQSVPNNNNANVVLLGQSNHNHNHHHHQLHHNNHHHNNNSGTNNINITNNNGNLLPAERNTESSRILSEKNALEKNLKKHSLFINALSWKRLAASHGKKKLDNQKNKAANLPTATFRPPLADAIHPLVVDKNKNIQQHQQRQHSRDHQSQQVYFTPGAPKSLLALDLVRANNTNPAQQPDKLAPKLPLALPLPLQPSLSSSGQQQQHIHGPRKTVIQVQCRFG